MTVAALSSAGLSQYIAAASDVPTSQQQALGALQISLTNGNLKAAQIALNAYNQLTVDTTVDSSSSPAAAPQLTKDLATLGTAISSGKLNAAQSAFASVQSDLKITPADAINNAAIAVAQTVQWVEDLLTLANPNATSNTSVDPTTAMFDSVYGINSNTNANPTVALLDNAYGVTSPTSTANTLTGPVSGTPNPTVAASSGNAGSGASVNPYA